MKWLAGFWVGIALWPASVPAVTPSYLAELQSRARVAQLAETREWQVLLHYEVDDLNGGLKSTAATSWFFNAPTGATDPQAELDATLAAFFSTRLLQARDEPAQCVFQARYRWLKSRLDFDPVQLLELDCDRLRVWLKALDAGAVTVVFPDAYLNSPASMFGHTLLRLDARGQNRKTELLAYAVNFAAETAEDNGLVFAMRGLTGGYPGSFGIYPYYEKVKEYARIENRDLWEYELRFTPEEVERMLLHLWELRGVTFDYYFLKYNCSYQLLALLESARPGLRLVGRFRGWAIPTDTLRALREVPELVGKIEYRPALSTTLARHADALSERQMDVVLGLTHAEITPRAVVTNDLPPREQAGILQVAHDYLYYQYLGQRMERETALPRAREILLARSQVEARPDFPAVSKPETEPDHGHGTRRLSVGVESAAGRSALGMRLRPAYHDLLDPPAGYGLGAQIGFLDIGLSIDLDDGDARLEDLRLIDIVSATPRTRLFKPVSWRVSTGLRRPLAPPFAAHAPGLGLYLEGGPGLTWGSLRSLAYIYALGSLDLNADLSEEYSAGLGVASGLRLQPRPEWGVLMELGTIDRLWGAETRERWISLGQQWQFNSRFGLRLAFERRDTREQDWEHAALSGQWYF